MSMPKPIANFETYLTAAMSPAATTFTIFDVTDDSGTSLNGKTCWFVIDSERILATVNGSTKVCTVVLRGVDPNVSTEEVADLKVEHEKGAPVRITDAHYLLQLTEMLSGDIALQGVPTLPASRTISTARQVVDKEYADAISVASFADFATVDAGGLNIDINAGTLVTFDGTIEFAGVSGQALTDNATNYVQLTQLGALSINTTGWTTGYVPLSKVVTLSGDITSISLNRGLITVPAEDRVITDDYLYGATITAGQPLYLDTATSKWKLASGAASATAVGPIGIALDSGVDNDSGKRVQTAGLVTGLSGLTLGYVYLGDTPGTFSSTPGTFRKAIGRALTTTTMNLMDTFQVARLSGVNADATTANFNEAMTFFANTAITAANSNTLIGGATSNADLLHTHNPMALIESSFAGSLMYMPIYLENALLGLTASTPNGSHSGSFYYEYGASNANAAHLFSNPLTWAAGALSPEGVVGAEALASLATKWTMLIPFYWHGLPSATDDFFVGLAAVPSGFTSGGIPTTELHIGYGYDGSNWYVSNANATTQTKTNVSAPSTGKQLLKIQRTASSIIFSLNGTVLSTSTTNLPASGPVGALMSCANDAGASTGAISLFRTWHAMLDFS